MAEAGQRYGFATKATAENAKFGSGFVPERNFDRIERISTAPPVHDAVCSVAELFEEFDVGYLELTTRHESGRHYTRPSVEWIETRRGSP